MSVSEKDSNQVFKIKPTEKNFRRHSAMLFGGVVSIGMAVMILLVSLQPNTELRSQADFEQTQTKVIPNLLENCALPYTGCHVPEVFVSRLPYPEDSKNLLLTTSQEYNLNPRVILTLYLMSDQDNKISQLDNSNLEAISSSLAKKARSTVAPAVAFTHTSGNVYQTGGITRASLVLVNYFSSQTRDRELFEAFVGIDEQAGVASFQRMYGQIIDRISR